MNPRYEKIEGLEYKIYVYRARKRKGQSERARERNYGNRGMVETEETGEEDIKSL